MRGSMGLAALIAVGAGALAQAAPPTDGSYGGFVLNGQKAAPFYPPDDNWPGFYTFGLAAPSIQDRAQASFKPGVGTSKVYAETWVGFSQDEADLGKTGDSIQEGAFAGWADGLTLTSSGFNAVDPAAGTATLLFNVDGSFSTTNIFQGGAGNVSFADAYFNLTASENGSTVKTFDVVAHYIDNGYANGAGIESQQVTVNGLPKQPFGSNFFGTYAVTIPFIEGQQISLTAELGCNAGSSIHAVGNSAHVLCDLAHSLNFVAFQNITDANGRTVADYSISTTSGFDYGLRPAAAPDAVPEPATWATMVAGFGLLGFALRRGRRRVAVRFG